MKFSLRFHEASIAALQCVYGFPVPYLVSGCADGDLYLWNLITRRPVASVQLHAQIVAIEVLNSRLYAVLCRDHELKFVEFAESSEVVQGPGRTLQALQVVYKVPVNCLNFANFAIEALKDGWYRLWCCSTMDSESIDVYEFKLREENSFKRIIEAANPFEVVSQLATRDQFKFDKLGIVMKFVSVGRGVLCGFESGFVCGLKLQDGYLDVFYVSSVHFPDPVLSMCYGKDVNEVYSSSTGNRIGVHHTGDEEVGCGSEHCRMGPVCMAKNMTVSNESIVVPVSKVSHLGLLDGVFLLGSWKGCVQGFQGRTVFEIRNDRSLVPVDDEYKANAENANAKRAWTKIGCVIGVEGHKFQELLKPCNFHAGEQRRLDQFLCKNWCVVGYENGTILFQQVGAPARKTIEA